MSAKSVSLQNIENYIYLIRGTKIMLDRDIALIYGIEEEKLEQITKSLSKSLAFKLNQAEWKKLKSQSVISNRHEGRITSPIAYNEIGIAVLSQKINSNLIVSLRLAMLITIPPKTREQFAERKKQLDSKHPPQKPLKPIKPNTSLKISTQSSSSLEIKAVEAPIKPLPLNKIEKVASVMIELAQLLNHYWSLVNPILEFNDGIELLTEDHEILLKEIIEAYDKFTTFPKHKKKIEEYAFSMLAGNIATLYEEKRTFEDLESWAEFAKSELREMFAECSAPYLPNYINNGFPAKYTKLQEHHLEKITNFDYVMNIMDKHKVLGQGPLKEACAITADILGEKYRKIYDLKDRVSYRDYKPITVNKENTNMALKAIEQFLNKNLND